MLIMQTNKRSIIICIIICIITIIIMRLYVWVQAAGPPFGPSRRCCTYDPEIQYTTTTTTTPTTTKTKIQI
jgi:hypothetical protein